MVRTILILNYFEKPVDKNLLRISLSTKNYKCLICSKIIRAGRFHEHQRVK